MADEFVVKNASVSLSAVVPTLTFDVSSHTLSLASSGPFATSDGQEILLESDVDASFATYTTPYKNASFSVPGTLMYQSIKSIDGLSELTKKDSEAVVLKSSSGTITCSITLPAQDTSSGSPVPDPAPSYDLDFSFSDAGQSLSKSD